MQVNKIGTVEDWLRHNVEVTKISKKRRKQIISFSFFVKSSKLNRFK